MSDYQQVATEEPEREPDYSSSDDSETEKDQTTVGTSQPRTTATTCTADVKEDFQEHYVMLPPPYGDNNDLPTYEEVERIKIEEEARDEELPYASLLSNAMTAGFFNGELEIGSDSTFLLTFLISLMFSWVGFMLTFCVSNSLAGRYGAVSGFGLSLVKWILIMSHSDTVGEESTYWLNAWVWWLLIVSGFTIFIRGIYLYIRAKQNPNSVVRGLNSTTNGNDNEARDENSSGAQDGGARRFAFYYLY